MIKIDIQEWEVDVMQDVPAPFTWLKTLGEFAEKHLTPGTVMECTNPDATLIVKIERMVSDD